MTKELLMPRDANNHPLPLIELSASHDVDGVGASAQSDPIDGYVVRIHSLDTSIRFLIGDNPVALATSHYLSADSEIYQPILPGQKVAVIGGKANISTAGV